MTINSERELLIMLDAMTNIIDKIEGLPEDCPAIKESELFKKITSEIKTLTEYLKNRAVEMSRQMDEINLQDAFRFNPGNKDEDN